MIIIGIFPCFEYGIAMRRELKNIAQSKKIHLNSECSLLLFLKPLTNEFKSINFQS